MIDNEALTGEDFYIYAFQALILWYSRDIFYYSGTAQPSYLVVLPDE